MSIMYITLEGHANKGICCIKMNSSVSECFVEINTRAHADLLNNIIG